MGRSKIRGNVRPSWLLVFNQDQEQHSELPIWTSTVMIVVHILLELYWQHVIY